MQGSLDKELIRRVIRQHMGEIRLCYEKELTKNPTLQGQILTQFTISKDGAVTSATIKSSTLRSAAVESCVTAAVARWTFPKPQGGGQVLITYPFGFKTAGDEEAPPKASEDEQLTAAQQAFIGGDAAEAIRLARAVQPPTARAWRIIGGAACTQKDPQQAQEAFEQLDAPGRQYLIYACQRQGLGFKKGKFVK